MPSVYQYYPLLTKLLMDHFIINSSGIILPLPKHDCSLKVIGSGSGIRTHGPVTASGFQDQCNRPLCHPAKKRLVSLGGNQPCVQFLEKTILKDKLVGAAGLEPTTLSRRSYSPLGLPICLHTQKEVH